MSSYSASNMGNCWVVANWFIDMTMILEVGTAPWNFSKCILTVNLTESEIRHDWLNQEKNPQYEVIVVTTEFL